MRTSPTPIRETIGRFWCLDAAIHQMRTPSTRSDLALPKPFKGAILVSKPPKTLANVG
jgi:hypothetical protein